jgi:hypothetical protein
MSRIGVESPPITKELANIGQNHLESNNILLIVGCKKAIQLLLWSKGRSSPNMPQNEHGLGMQNKPWTMKTKLA